MDRSKRMLYGGIAAVVVIALIAIVAWPRYSQDNKVATCAPSTNKPDVKSIKVENLASSDSTVLANLAGYVELIGEKDKTYLPLDVNSVKYKSKDDVTTITYEGECVNVDVTYEVAKDSKEPTVEKYNFRSIDMELKKENANEAEKICDFDMPFTFNQPIDNRYSCELEQSHQCSTKVDKRDKPVANLVLKSFEMEFARAEGAKKGEFVKKPWNSSCISWDK